MLHIVAKFGIVVIIAAWLSVFVMAVVMIFVLRHHSMQGIWLRSTLAGSLSLFAHMLDFFTTLKVSPDLAFEANPIWCLVVGNMGLTLAHWYGFTGKLLLSVLSFQFFAYYLLQRKSLLPEHTSNFLSFWQNFGLKKHGRGLSFANLKNFFAFLFALIGPFCFYIAFLNSITSDELYLRLPPMPLMLAFYILILTFVYVFGNYWSARALSTSSAL